MAWLIGRLADAGFKKMTTLVLGTEQQRALRQAAAAAVERTAGQLAPSGGEQAEQLARAIGKAFRDPAPDATVAGQATLLEALRAGIAGKLAVLDDPGITGAGQSSAGLPRVQGGVLAETLAGHLIREIMVRGSRGGPLAPLADQLNHDVTHLQGQRLEGMLTRMADQVMALAEAGGGAEAPRKPVRLPPRSAFLAGREELLAQVGSRLAAGDDPGPQTVTLYGLGGTGKTSAAVEYAYRHLADVGVAWQFAAEDATVLAAGFGELAAELGAKGLADTRDPVTSVHAVLAAFAVPWLLIFDNATDMASVAAFLPPAGPGRVLITSQNPNWPGLPLNLPTLVPDIAADFLVKRTGQPDRQAARDLADMLDGLPLALEQAAAYIQAAGDTLAGYLALFRRRRADLLARGEPTGYSKTVASTWALAFDRLQHTTPTAVGLLRLLAFCASEAIPLRLLLQPRPGLTERLDGEVAPVLVQLLEDELAAGDAIMALRRYSLISPPADGSVSVHRLVQAVTADQMPAGLASQWRQATVVLIDAAIPDDPELPEAWPACAALLPHAQAVLDLTSEGMFRIARYLGFSGNYPAARDQFAALLSARGRVLGPEHLGTLAARQELARWTGEAGDPAAARDQYVALLPVRKQAFGPEHPDTLGARHELAQWTGAAGDAAAARDQYAALLPVEERVLGPEHPEALNTRGNLAYWTGEAGDAAAARDQYAALLPVEERVLGPEHPDTLNTRGNLAHWTGEAGDETAARDQYAALQPVYERVLGPEHPNTLDARHDLAAWTGFAGDAAAAREQYAVLLPARGRVLGPEHPNTLLTRAELASWTGAAGDAARARDQFAALLPVYERVQGLEHPDTLIARASLAHWTGEAGDAASARDQYAALLPVLERVQGPEHPDTLSARATLASWTGDAGDAAAARDQYAALLPVQERVVGPEHPSPLASRDEFARWTGEAGDAAAARDQYAALLPIRERVLGPEHPETLTTRQNLAHWTEQAKHGNKEA
jgi:Tetratricopeptide repeat